MKLLIVDDNKMLVEIYTTGLMERGFEVIYSISGSECLNILKKEIPDIILMDIMMPCMDGWETLMEIRSNPVTKNIPVLMLTAKALTIEDINDYGDYIDGFLIKPFTLDGLSERIHDFNNKRQEYLDIVSEAHKICSDSVKVDEWAELGREFYVIKNLVSVFEDEYGELFRDSSIKTGLPDILDRIMGKCRKRGEIFFELTDELGLSGILPEEFRDNTICITRSG